MKTMAAVYEIPFFIGVPLIALSFFMPTDQIQYVVGITGLAFLIFAYGFGALFTLTVFAIRAVLWVRLRYLDWRGYMEILPPSGPANERRHHLIDGDSGLARDQFGSLLEIPASYRIPKAS